MEKLKIWPFELLPLRSEEELLLNSLRERSPENDFLIDLKDALQNELDKYEVEDDDKIIEFIVGQMYIVEQIYRTLSKEPEILDKKEDEKYKMNVLYKIIDIIRSKYYTFLYDFSSSFLNRTLTHEERQTLVKSCGTDDLATLLVRIIKIKTNADYYIPRLVIIDKYKAMVKKKLSELFQRDIDVEMETKYVQKEDEDEEENISEDIFVSEDVFLIIRISTLYKHDFQKILEKRREKEEREKMVDRKNSHPFANHSKIC